LLNGGEDGVPPNAQFLAGRIHGSQRFAAFYWLEIDNHRTP